jgi:hypothetical protein
MNTMIDFPEERNMIMPSNEFDLPFSDLEINEYEYDEFFDHHQSSYPIHPLNIMLSIFIAMITLSSILIRLSLILSPVENKTLPTTCNISHKYPQSIQQWCPIITKYAEKKGLPADLIAAIILQESEGNPNAYSNSGAIGLMQIMPRDGLAASFMCINGPCFSNRPTMVELEDPEFNISYGTHMIADLITQKGNYREALKSYGPMDIGYSYADKILEIFTQFKNDVQ